MTAMKMTTNMLRRFMTLLFALLQSCALICGDARPLHIRNGRIVHDRPRFYVSKKYSSVSSLQKDNNKQNKSKNKFRWTRVYRSDSDNPFNPLPIALNGTNNLNAGFPVAIPLIPLISNYSTKNISHFNLCSISGTFKMHKSHCTENEDECYAVLTNSKCVDVKFDYPFAQNRHIHHTMLTFGYRYNTGCCTI